MVVKKRGDLTNGLPPNEQSGGGDLEQRPDGPQPRSANGLDRATELELIDAALPGDMQPFSELFEHYRSALYGLCSRRLNDPSLAEDVVQEVFLKGFKNLSSYDRDKPVWPWLSTIALRMCIDLQRHRSLTRYSGDILVALDEENGTNGHTESALDELIASEDRAEVWSSLDVLPERQRRVFLSYAMDAMSYAEIAAAEGISIGAVELLLVRARKKMRKRAGGPLPAIVFPLTWLRWKLQRMADQIGMLIGVSSEGLSGAGLQVVSLGALALAIITASVTRSGDSVNMPRFDSLVAVASQQQGPVAGSSSPALGRKSTTPNSAPFMPEVPAQSLTKDVVDPSWDATPENSRLHSITLSPNYERDHTIFSAGNCPKFSCGVVFVSRDGGGNWSKLPSRFFLGSTLLLPPSYPADPRIFAVGKVGDGPKILQESIDGGESFRAVGPLGLAAAISPAFGKGDDRFLVGYDAIVDYFDYRLDREPAKPLMPLGVPVSLSSYYSSIAFSPAYPADPVILVGTADHPGNTNMWKKTPLIFRCDGLSCHEIELAAQGDPNLRLSPRFALDGLAYAFTSFDLLISVDGARTFQRAQSPVRCCINDLTINWDSDPPALLAAVGDLYGGGSIYHSIDGGRSWDSPVPIGLPGFEGTVFRATLTPTGRVLAVGHPKGVACSEDNGQTWAPRCSPE